MPESINRDDNFDLFTDLFETLRIKGSIFFHSDLASPWGMSFHERGLPLIHVALAGNCHIGVGAESKIHLKQMDFAMLPIGGAHWVADKPGRKLVESEEAGSACVLGKPLFQDGKITNRLMCGFVRFEQNISHPFIESLPEFMHFENEHFNKTAWATATLIDSEIQRTKSNIGPIIDRLTEVLLLQLLSNYFENYTTNSGFIAAVRDPRLKHALNLIHQYPEINWSLNDLGNEIGMSRATLIRHFQNTIGMSPNTYIHSWKMLKAYNLVKYSAASLDNISEQLGFSSSRTLTRAFKRYHNATPASFRHDPSENNN